MPPFRIALDWTANTNHTPIYVALAKGYYAKAGLDVEIITPASDGYTTSPASRLARGEVDIALCPSESIISYRLDPHRTPLKAVAALLSKDASSVAVLASSGITRPKDLDGRSYASYNARFEDGTIRGLIRADGGKGDLKIVQQPRLDIWEYITQGSADATWIFTAWEGLLAKQAGKEVTTFSLTDHGIPYGYSPVLAANEDSFDAERVKKFLKATARAAEDTVNDTETAVKIMEDVVPRTDRGIVRESLGILVSGVQFGEADRWGDMSLERWEAWVQWLRSEKLLEDKIAVEDLFTNDLL